MVLAVSLSLSDSLSQESAENEKTFFQKYWLYIAAFGFFMVIQIVGAAAAGGAPQ